MKAALRPYANGKSHRPQSTYNALDNLTDGTTAGTAGAHAPRPVSMFSQVKAEKLRRASSNQSTGEGDGYLQMEAGPAYYEAENIPDAVYEVVLERETDDVGGAPRPSRPASDAIYDKAVHQFVRVRGSCGPCCGRQAQHPAWGHERCRRRRAHYRRVFATGRVGWFVAPRGVCLCLDWAVAVA